jgi:hypothetical protein
MSSAVMLDKRTSDRGLHDGAVQCLRHCTLLVGADVRIARGDPVPQPLAS